MIGCDFGLPSLVRMWVYLACRRKSELRIGWPEGSLWQRLTICLVIIFPLPEHTRRVHFSTSLEVRRISCVQHLVSGMLWKWCMLFLGLAAKPSVYLPHPFSLLFICWMKMSELPWNHKMEKSWVPEMLCGGKLLRRTTWPGMSTLEFMLARKHFDYVSHCDFGGVCSSR